MGEAIPVDDGIGGAELTARFEESIRLLTSSGLLSENPAERP